MTTEIQKDSLEYFIKCRDDILFFTENHINLRTPNGLVEKIILYPYQIQLLHDNNITARTSRGIGLSTLSYIKMVHSIIFNNMRTIVVYSVNNDMARHTIQGVSELLDLCDFFIKPKFVVRNKQEIRFDNEMRVITATSANSLRGYTLSEIYVQDIDHKNEDIDEFIHSVMPTLFSGRIKPIIWMWSGLGIKNNLAIFREYIKNIDKNKLFKHYELPWYVLPKKDSAWYREMPELIGEHSFEIEYKNVL